MFRVKLNYLGFCKKLNEAKYNINSTRHSEKNVFAYKIYIIHVLFESAPISKKILTVIQCQHICSILVHIQKTGQV